MILKLPILLLLFGISCADPNQNYGVQNGNQQGQGGHNHAHPQGGQTEVPKGPPKPYTFSYGVHGDKHGGNFGQHEESDGKTVKGAYVVNLPDGRQQVVSYTAGKEGFQADVKYVGEAKYPTGTVKSGQQATPNDLIKGEHQGSYSNQNTQSGYQPPENQHRQQNQRDYPSHARQETNVVQDHRGSSQPDNTQHYHHGNAQPSRRSNNAGQTHNDASQNQFSNPHQVAIQAGQNRASGRDATHQQRGSQENKPYSTQHHSNPYENSQSRPYQQVTDSHQGPQSAQNYGNSENTSPHHAHTQPQKEINHPHQGISPNQNRRNTNQNDHYQQSQNDQPSYDDGNHGNSDHHEPVRNSNHHDGNQASEKRDNSGDSGDSRGGEDYHKPNHNKERRHEEHQRDYSQQNHQRPDDDNKNQRGHHHGDNSNRNNQEKNHQEERQNNRHNHGQDHNRNDGHDHNQNHGHDHNQNHGHDQNQNHGHDHNENHGGHDHTHDHGHENENDDEQNQGNKELGESSDHKEQANDEDDFANDDFFRTPKGFGASFD